MEIVRTFYDENWMSNICQEMNRNCFIKQYELDESFKYELYGDTEEEKDVHIGFDEYLVTRDRIQDLLSSVDLSSYHNLRLKEFKRYPDQKSQTIRPNMLTYLVAEYLVSID